MLQRSKSLSRRTRSEVVAEYQKQFNKRNVGVRKRVLQRLSVLESLENFEYHIVHKDFYTPASYADHYSVGAGISFAFFHGFTELSVTHC